MTSVITTLAIVVAFSTSSQSDWAKLIADAQAMHRSSWRHGHLVCDVLFLPRKDLKEMSYHVDIRWSGERYLMKYSASDPNISPSDVQKQDEGLPLGNRPSFQELSANDGLFIFNPYSPLLSTFRSTRPIGSYWLRVSPLSSWLRCCPPTSNDGITWTEMLGREVEAKTGERSEITFEAIDADLVKQTRLDPGVGKLEVLYSMDKAMGNVVDFRYMDPGGNIGTHGAYAWKRSGNTVVLSSYEWTRMVKGTSATVDSHYKIDVASVSLDEEPDALFDSTEFISSLPDGLKVVDRDTGSESRLPGKPENVESQADTMSKLLRSRGFLKKPGVD